MSLRKNALWNLAGSGLPLLAAAALIPYMLKAMGNEAFGVLTLIWALIGYFSLFDLGVGRSLTYEISKLLGAGGDAQTIKPTMHAGLILTTGTGILGAWLVWNFAPILATDWLKISPIYQSDATTAFQIAALAIVPTTITSGLRGALEGCNRFAASNLSKIILGFGMFILPSLALVVHGLSLAYITAYLFGMRLIILLIVFFQVNPLLKNNGKPLTFQHFNKLFNYGFWVTMTGLISPLMVYGDRFIISSIIGATTLAYYSIPQEGLFRLLVIPSAIGAALLPILTTAKEVEQKKLYQKNFKRVAYLMFGICLSTAALSYPMLAVWLGSEFANQSIGITLILVIGIFINSVSIIPYVFLQANGKPFIIAKFHLIELAAYLPLIFILVNNFGLIGAALAWAFRVLVDYILLTNAMRKEIDFTH